MILLLFITVCIVNDILILMSAAIDSIRMKNPENSRKGEINRGHIGLVIVSKVRALMEPSV